MLLVSFVVGRVGSEEIAVMKALLIIRNFMVIVY